MKLMIALLTFVTVNALASNKAAIDAIAEKAGEEIRNGDISVSAFNVKKFKLAKVVADMGSYNQADNECTYIIDSDKKANIDLIGESYVQGDSSIQDDLKALDKKGQIKAIVSAAHDEGESEACALYAFRIFTVDGIILDVEFNHTD